MKGRIISYSVQTNSGEISGDDGIRYTFVGQDWRDSQVPARGMYVEFEALDSQAVNVFLVLDRPNPGAPGPAPVYAKSKIAAGVLAILLGAFGIHKFYLGYTGPGILLLLATVLTCFLAAWITGIIGLIEGIIYLTKTDEEFDQVYVQGRKSFF